MQIHRTMLSQMRLVDDRYAACKPLPPPPTMPMPVPQQQQHNYGYATPVLPPLRFAAMASYHPPAPVLRPPPPPPMMRMTTPPVPMMAPGFHQSAPLSPASPSAHKCSLSFILSSDAAPSTTDDRDASSLQNEPLGRPRALKHKRRDPSTAAAGSKSKYCTTEGCTSRAKHARKCWRHGGSVKCKVTDCINRAKSRGVCWSHGGGTTCSHSNCGTIAVSHGFCWAHGGGKRCQIGGCSRPAYERTENLCATHFKQHKAAKSSAASTTTA